MAAYFLGQIHVCGKGVEFSCSKASKMFRASFNDEEATFLDPIWANSARAELAWIHSACTQENFKRDNDLALRLIKVALSKDFDAYKLDTLAAAQANLGDFKSAILTQKKAIIELNLTSKKSPVELKTKNSFASRLALYKVNEPARFTQLEAEKECNAFP